MLHASRGVPHHHRRTPRADDGVEAAAADHEHGPHECRLRRKHHVGARYHRKRYGRQERGRGVVRRHRGAHGRRVVGERLRRCLVVRFDQASQGEHQGDDEREPEPAGFLHRAASSSGGVLRSRERQDGLACVSSGTSRRNWCFALEKKKSGEAEGSFVAFVSGLDNIVTGPRVNSVCVLCV